MSLGSKRKSDKKRLESDTLMECLAGMKENTPRFPIQKGQAREEEVSCCWEGSIIFFQVKGWFKLRFEIINLKNWIFNVCWPQMLSSIFSFPTQIHDHICYRSSSRKKLEGRLELPLWSRAGVWRRERTNLIRSSWLWLGSSTLWDSSFKNRRFIQPKSPLLLVCFISTSWNCRTPPTFLMRCRPACFIKSSVFSSFLRPSSKSRVSLGWKNCLLKHKNV